MRISQEEVLAFWYLYRLNPCNMRDLPCVQPHSIRCGLDELNKLLVEDGARRYYYLLDNFEILESRFIGHRNKIRRQIEGYNALIQDDDILKPRKDHFVQLFNDMDLNLFHIENIHVKSDSFGSVYRQVSNSTTKQIKQLFKDVKNATELYHKLTKTERKYYAQLIEINLGKDFMSQITNDISKIRGWFIHALDKSNK